MQLFYLLGLYLYALVVRIVVPFNTKARLFRDGRRQLFDRLRAAVPKGSPVVWFHCASLGEFEQGRPLIEAYRSQHPDDKILLTFFSPSGYEIRKNYTGADWVFYLPIDTPRNARRFVQLVQPKMAVFVKYDFWYYLLKNLKKQQVPTYVISAIFRPQQAFFKWYGSFFRTMLRAYTYLFVQNNESVELLETIGITNVVVAGDTRFDRVWELAQSPKELPALQQFCNTQPTIVAGSTWPADEEKLVVALANLPTTKLIIAPHEVHEEHIAAIVKLFEKFGVVRYSEIQVSSIKIQDSESILHSARVLIIDTIGILSSAYRYGTVAYIGGGFGAGIHNTLEAAVYGIPVVFGPNYQRFREACELIETGGAATYATEQELTGILTNWLVDTTLCHTLGNSNKRYVESHRGATQTILELFF